MARDDDKFVGFLRDPDPASRQTTMLRWKRERTGKFIAFAGFALAALLLLYGGQAALCGLFSGISAVHFAAAVSADTRIKFALLADELQRT